MTSAPYNPYFVKPQLFEYDSGIAEALTPNMPIKINAGISK